MAGPRAIVTRRPILVYRVIILRVCRILRETTRVPIFFFCNCIIHIILRLRRGIYLVAKKKKKKPIEITLKLIIFPVEIIRIHKLIQIILNTL